MSKILFIDDEPEYVRPQVMALEEVGFSVTLESDLESALEQLQTQEIDLIILDLIMPPADFGDMTADRDPDFAETGTRMYDWIRKDPRLMRVPIIFLSVVRDQDIRHHLREREMRIGNRFRFLVKPVSSSRVVDTVEQALGVQK